jgi:hypothetical protein
MYPFLGFLYNFQKKKFIIDSSLLGPPLGGGQQIKRTLRFPVRMATIKKTNNRAVGVRG